MTKAMTIVSKTWTNQGKKRLFHRKRRIAFRFSRGITALLCICLLFPALFPGVNADAAGDVGCREGGNVEFLCPGGMPFGVRFSMEGVLVAGVTEVWKDGGKVSPAKDAGLQEKDMILEADGEVIDSVEQLSAILENSGGNALTLRISREGKEKTLTITPVASDPDGIYRAGMWIRDSTAGIGTVTFIDPSTGAFAGLGHGICDSDTGLLLPLREGKVTEVVIRGIKKGAPGNPGELQGFFGGKDQGELTANAQTGVYGIYEKEQRQALLRDPLPVATMGELHTGKASILCTLGKDGVRSYEVEIEHIGSGESSCKNFSIHVTDPALLGAAGGIVQGMSGSPVIQDGKLAGAVTHVRISDPTRGYGIFIGNMLENLPA